MSLMYAQMGMSAVKSLSAFGQARHDANMERIGRDYRETMTSISASMQANNLTHNEIAARDSIIRAGQSLQIQSLQDRASATTAAAAAGVGGGSVTNTIRGLMRSRLMATKAMQERQKAQVQSNTNSRRQLALGRVMGKDVSAISKPSAASALLGMGASVLDIYDSHQTPGNRMADTLAGWGRK